MITEIAVVAHKDAEFPSELGYIPFFVGKRGVELSKRYNGLVDSIGSNIADLNQYYSELTAQYWMWKNSSADIKGLVHYRRYFIIHNHLLTKKEITNILNDYSAIVGHEFKIKGGLTVRQNYEKYHYKSDLDAVEQSLKNQYPSYESAFDHVMNKHSLHAMNMLIASKKVYNAYSEWLFTILMNANIDFEEVRNRVSFQQRSIGFLSERLLDVWLEYNQIRYFEVETLQTNHPNRKHTNVNKFIEQHAMRAQKGMDKMKRILSGTQI